MKNINAVALGSIKTKKKAKSARINGKLGGRPRLCLLCRGYIKIGYWKEHIKTCEMAYKKSRPWLK